MLGFFSSIHTSIFCAVHGICRVSVREEDTEHGSKLICSHLECDASSDFGHHRDCSFFPICTKNAQPGGLGGYHMLTWWGSSVCPWNLLHVGPSYGPVGESLWVCPPSLLLLAHSCDLVCLLHHSDDFYDHQPVSYLLCGFWPYLGGRSPPQLRLALLQPPSTYFNSRVLQAAVCRGVVTSFM